MMTELCRGVAELPRSMFCSICVLWHKCYDGGTCMCIMHNSACAEKVSGMAAMTVEQRFDLVLSAQQFMQLDSGLCFSARDILMNRACINIPTFASVPADALLYAHA